MTPSTAQPTVIPTASPLPTTVPSKSPTLVPSIEPIVVSSLAPTSATPSTDPTSAPTLNGESNLYFDVAQIVDGINLKQWNSDSNCEVVLKQTVSAVTAVDANSIDHVQASDVTVTTVQLRSARRLATASLYVTYSIYYTEDITSSSYVVYDEISSKLSTALLNGNFTKILQQKAVSYNVAVMSNVSSSVTGLDITKPKLVTTSVSTSNHTISPMRIVFGVVAVLVTCTCGGACYYYFDAKKKKKRKKEALKDERELGLNGAFCGVPAERDYGDIYCNTEGSSVIHSTVNPMTNSLSSADASRHSTLNPMMMMRSAPTTAVSSNNTKVNVVKNHMKRIAQHEHVTKNAVIGKALRHSELAASTVEEQEEQEDLVMIQNYLLQHCGVTQFVSTLLAKSLVKTYHLNSVAKLCSSYKSQELLRILESIKPYITDEDVLMVMRHFASLDTALPQVLTASDDPVDSNIDSDLYATATADASISHTNKNVHEDELPPPTINTDESEDNNFKSALSAWKKRRSVITLSPMAPY